MFTTAVDQQRSMLIHVLQGERERAKDNWSLGKFTLEFEGAARGVPRVGVQFEIDANGILHVLARNVATGKEKVVKIKSAVDVDDVAVQRMVEESVEHAFEDLAARKWIEVKLKAEALVTATQKALVEATTELGAEKAKEIESVLNEVMSLTQENSITGIGNTKELELACSRLDEATRPLAEILMDRAMEAVLRERGLLH